MAMMETKISLDLTGMNGILRKAVSQVRDEVMAAFKDVASRESDGRVVARLSEIVMHMDGTLAGVDAQLAMAEAPNPNESRRNKVSDGV